MQRLQDSIIDLDVYEQKLFVIVNNVLSSLIAKKTDLQHTETGINKEFCRLFRAKRQEMLPFSLHVQYRIQPSELTPTEAEYKDPEGTWLINDNAEPPIRYDIECKRLLKPTSNWCKYYVNGGMKRFLSKSHCYSLNHDKGIMIGYVLDLDFQDAHDSINSYANKNGYTNMQLIDAWNEKGISRLEQVFTNREFEPKPFHLRHFWVDLRK